MLSFKQSFTYLKSVRFIQYTEHTKLYSIKCQFQHNVTVKVILDSQWMISPEAIVGFPQVHASSKKF